MPKQKPVKKKKLSEGIHLHRTEITAHKKRGVKPQWYWNLIARNGRELARSSETYSSKAAATRSILSVATYFDNNQHYFDHTTRTAKDMGVPDLIVYDIQKV